MAQIVGTEYQDHYLVLGISSTATPDEIRRAYRQQMKIHHPDTGDGDREALHAAQAAYEVLSDDARRKAYDATRYRQADSYADSYYTPRTGPITTVEIKDEMFYTVPVKVETVRTQGWYTETIRRLVLTLVQFQILVRVNGYGIFHASGYDEVKVTKDGDVCFTSAPYSWTVENHYEEWRRAEERRKIIAPYAQSEQILRTRYNAFKRLGYPVEGLAPFLALLKMELEQQGELYAWRVFSPGKLAELTRQIEHGLAKFDDASPEGVAGWLMDGTLAHPDVAFNNELLQKLVMLYIRSGEDDIFMPPTPEQMKAHYAAKVAGVSIAHIEDADLKLDEAALIPPGYVEEYEREIGLAPAAVSLIGAKGKAHDYLVTYSYFEVKGKRVPTGFVTVPLSVYERYRPEYGKKSGFPDLGHGIKLFITVVYGGKELASGYDTQELVDKMSKRVKGLKRVPDTNGTMGMLFGDVSPTPPPPWAAGNAARGNRRR